jgi:hypothetical protein
MGLSLLCYVSRRRLVGEICTHLRFSAAQNGNSVPTVWDNISVKQSKKNVGNTMDRDHLEDLDIDGRIIIKVFYLPTDALCISLRKH